jgi:hypothetical protein
MPLTDRIPIFQALFLFTFLFVAPMFSFAHELELNEYQPTLVVADANLSVNDLGFAQTDMQSDLSQKDLDTREDMLKIHQILGVITEVPLLTEFILGLTTAGNVSAGSTDTTLHTTLGFGTVALYLTAASFEVFAPKPKNKKRTGNTGIHEALSWIHLPLMIVVPLLGDMMNDRIANNQPLGNLPAVHGVMATTLLLTYTASLTVITF